MCRAHAVVDALAFGTVTFALMHSQYALVIQERNNEAKKKYIPFLLYFNLTAENSTTFIKPFLKK